MNRIDVDTETLLEALEAEFEGPAVVAIGGGHGLAQALLAVQHYAADITALVGVADNGGSSGRLRPALGIPPPGDIRRCLIALSPDASVWRELFSFRFDEGDIGGHSLGNLILAALTEIEGGFEAALRIAETCLGAVGRVVPAATEPLHLEAVVDGTVVDGQLAIARSRGKITDLRIVPGDVEPSPWGLEAIAAADQIVLGPGSLYTSVIPPLLVPGVAEAINDSDAVLVYVCNLVTQDGETLGMTGVDHVDALGALGRVRSPDAIVANTAPIEVAPPLEPVHIDPESPAMAGHSVVAEVLVDVDEPHRHDAVRLGTVLAGLAG